MSTKASTNAVFPIKFTAVHRRTGNKVSVISTGVVNTTDENDGEIMVLYSDGERMFTKESGEFNEKYALEKDYD